jgi:hypothetical protein
LLPDYRHWRGAGIIKPRVNVDGAFDGVEKDDAIKIKQNQWFTTPIDD